MYKKLIIFTLSILMVLLLSSCKEDSNLKTPSPVSTKRPVDTTNPLILSSIPLEKDTGKGWNHLADYLSSELGIKVIFKKKDSYKEIITGLNDGNIDIAYTGALIYIKAHKESGIEPLVKPGFANKKTPFYKTCIITRKDSKIKSIEDLKGKKFAFTNKNSTSGFLIPISILYDNGVTDLNFFSEYIFTSDQNSSFLSVYKGYADAGAVYNRIFEDDSSLLEEINIIKKSEDIPSGPVVVKKEMNKVKREQIKEAFLKIGLEEDTLQLAKELDVNQYYEANDRDYDCIRKALDITEKMGLKVE